MLERLTVLRRSKAKFLFDNEQVVSPAFNAGEIKPPAEIDETGSSLAEQTEPAFVYASFNPEKREVFRPENRRVTFVRARLES